MKTLIIAIVVLYAVNLLANAEPSSINKAIETYLKIGESLVSSDAGKTFPKINAEQNEQNQVTQFITNFNIAIENINKATSVDNRRVIFAGLSTTLIRFLRENKLNDATLYLHYCPMKKVHWMSKSYDVKNPFYGRLMMNCGSTVETFKGEGK